MLHIIIYLNILKEIPVKSTHLNQSLFIFIVIYDGLHSISHFSKVITYT